MGKLKAKLDEWKENPEGLPSWLDNPHWAGYYQEAPTDRCKLMVMLELYYSDTEDEEAAEAMDTIDQTLNLEELKHLLKYAGNTPRKGLLAKRIEKLA